jgi:hypothetical protein
MLFISIIYLQFPCENHFSSADARLREVFCQLESKTELFPKNSPKFYPHNFFLTDIHPSGNLKYIDGWLKEISSLYQVVVALALSLLLLGLALRGCPLPERSE